MITPLAVWQPSLAVFIRRCFWLGGATFVFFGAFGFYVNIWQIVIAAPLLIPLYVFLFDDHLKWLEVKNDRWVLTPTTLIREATDGQGQVPLADVTSVTTRFNWTVTLHLKSGLRVQIPYVKAPKEIGAQIIAARNALTL